jgi:transposase-like protein
MNDSCDSVSTRRARSSASERAQWAQRFFQSGLSQRDFALQHGLKLSTLQRWVAQQHPAAPSAPAFVEVKLPPAASHWAAELVRADGSVLRLAAHVPTAWFESLLWPC